MTYVDHRKILIAVAMPFLSLVNVLVGFEFGSGNGSIEFNPGVSVLWVMYIVTSLINF
jgi:hypothetical protein